MSIPRGARSALAIAALLWAALVSCRRPVVSQPAGADPEVRRVTVWEGPYEVFAEHPPLVAGKPARFAIHVTHAASGAPRTKGSLTLVLRSPAGAEERSTIDRPLRPGLYTADLVFNDGGDWRLSLVLADGGAPTEVAVPLGPVAATGSGADRGHDVPPDPDGISFLKEDQWRHGLRTEVVRRRDIVAWARFPAVVRASPRGRAVVSAPFAGVLAAPAGEELPALGGHVQEGQILARIEPPLAGADAIAVVFHQHELGVLETDLDAKLANAKLEEERSHRMLALAESTLARVRELARLDAKSRSELERAGADAASAASAHVTARAVHATYSKARAELHSHSVEVDERKWRLPHLDLRAPLSGVVERSRAIAGAHVAVGDELLTLVDPTTVWVEVLVPETVAATLRPGDGAVLEPPLAGRLELLHFGLEVDGARRVTLSFRAANPDGTLRIGMAANVSVATGRSRTGLAVPAAAIVDDRGVDVVFVVLQGELFERRVVTRGIGDRDGVEVLEGLAEGEHVVVAGADLIRLAALAPAVQAHSHEH